MICCVTDYLLAGATRQQLLVSRMCNASGPSSVMCYFTASICITLWWTGDSVTLCGQHRYSLSSYGRHGIIYCGIWSAPSCWLDLVVSIASECDRSYKCVWPILEIDIVGSGWPPVTAAVFFCWTLCTWSVTVKLKWTTQLRVQLWLWYASRLYLYTSFELFRLLIRKTTRHLILWFSFFWYIQVCHVRIESVNQWISH